jgi:hypothetical protein
MAPRRTRQRLQRDRQVLFDALNDYEAGPVGHLDELEQATTVDSIRKRIADLDARIEQLSEPEVARS